MPNALLVLAALAVVDLGVVGWFEWERRHAPRREDW